MRFRWSVLLLLALLFPAVTDIQMTAASTTIPVYIFAGQSNMEGWKTNVADLTPEQRAPQPQVLFYGPNPSGATWTALTPPTQLGVADGDVGFGPEISVGQRIVGAGVAPLVACIKYAVGATSLAHDWQPAGPGPLHLYENMLARVHAAVAALQSLHPDRTITIAGFFWMQGESDGLTQADADAYAANLSGLIARVRADFNTPQLPFILGRIRLGVFPFAPTVRAAQAQVAVAVSNVVMVDTDALALDADSVHYTSAGTVALGVALADGYLALPRAAAPTATLAPTTTPLPMPTTTPLPTPTTTPTVTSTPPRRLALYLPLTQRE